MRALLLTLALLSAGCSHGRLTTDRATYEPTDAVELKLTNLGTSRIGYNLCISQAEHEIGGRFEAVQFPDHVCTMELRILRPFRSARFTLPLDGKLEPGTYRLSTHVELPFGTRQRALHTEPFEVVPAG